MATRCPSKSINRSSLSDSCFALSATHFILSLSNSCCCIIFSTNSFVALSALSILDWLTKGQGVLITHQGHQREDLHSVQTIACTDNLPPRSILRNSSTKVKAKPDMMDVEGVLYSIHCGECSDTFVGETRRTLIVLMTGHKRVMKNKDPKKGIAMHVQKTAHTINCLVRENN